MIERLVPAYVRTAEAFTDDPGEAVFPGEEHLVERAVPGRRQEFVTARRCARTALAALGVPAGPILSGEARAPRWPAGVIGSITHCAGYRAAVVARAGDAAGIGIDGEPHRPLPEGVEEAVTIPGEREALARLALDHPAVHWDKLLFSAKESVYKAWYPLTGRWLGFEEARLTLDPAGTFTAEILVDGSRTDGGEPLRVLNGRFLVERDLVLTAVTIPF
jgi:4'-phosphopantetheinyl transferase EntD